MAEYIVFFGLIAVALVFFILDFKREKPTPIVTDHERIKCESPIERRLYDALQLRGYYVQT